jgi:hypothetical protein
LIDSRLQIAYGHTFVGFAEQIIDNTYYIELIKLPHASIIQSGAKEKMQKVKEFFHEISAYICIKISLEPPISS